MTRPSIAWTLSGSIARARSKQSRAFASDFGGDASIDPIESPEPEVQRIRIGGRLRPSRLDAGDLGAQLVGDPRDDLVLHVEQFGDRLVEPLGPEMGGRLRLDQLHVDPHPVAAALDAALEHVAHVEVPADLADVDRLAPVGESRVPRDHEAARDAGKVGGQALRHAVDEIFVLGTAAEVGERQDDHRKARRPDAKRGRGVAVTASGRGGREDANRPRDVLQDLLAEVRELDVQASLHVLVGGRGHADAAGRRNGLETSGDVDPVADEVVALDQNVAEVNPHPVTKSAGRRQRLAAARSLGLHGERARDGGDHGREFDQEPVTHGLEHPAAVSGDQRLRGLAALPHRGRRAGFVLAHHPRVADDVGGKDRGKAAEWGHVPCLTRRRVRHIRSGGRQRRRPPRGSPADGEAQWRRRLALP